jgi:hypothetical protein
MRLADIPLDHTWTQGSHRNAPIIYLTERPEDDIEVMKNAEMGVPRDPLCPVCATGHLSLVTDEMGYCDLYVCAKGCSARFGFEMD